MLRQGWSWRPILTTALRRLSWSSPALHPCGTSSVCARVAQWPSLMTGAVRSPSPTTAKSMWMRAVGVRMLGFWCDLAQVRSVPHPSRWSMVAASGRIVGRRSRVGPAPQRIAARRRGMGRGAIPAALTLSIASSAAALRRASRRCCQKWLCRHLFCVVESGLMVRSDPCSLATSMAIANGLSLPRYCGMQDSISRALRRHPIHQRLSVSSIASQDVGDRSCWTRSLSLCQTRSNIWSSSLRASTMP